ncbi:MAG TPA: methionyl-tRNA formyltransferase [Candidatus Onthousia faecipullorum]|uniref:Methionyl-tRNA formyltransferase n=1 Tax=Candidatus Onthousia faecipullorum TaxID=2840887 RepID=A0A9D1GBT9_9FIRM|nr:methionyl-tRNA formyltransferase [Candidatus Onthousia faecipullorum]
MKDIRIVFMGTPLFAVPIFNALAENYNVVAVVTQPDKLVGRKQILTPSPIKKASALYNIPVLQPVKIRDEYEKVLKYKPDMIVTCAYGQILPKELLDYPKYKCINVHASLLPKLRGGAPIHHAIMDGYDKTGITIMYMDVLMDAGDIISQSETNITKDDTLGSLHDRLSEMGKDLLLETLPNIINGNINPLKQDENEVTYGYNITKEDEKIDFTKSNIEVDNKVRALNPSPGAYTTLNGKRLKVYDVILSNRNYNKTEPGTIVGFEKDGIRVVTGDKEIILIDIAIEGKKRCLVKDYLNGIDKKDLLGVVLK